MGFSDGGQLAIYIREAAAPHAQRLLAALPKRQQETAIKRCAAAFEAAANGDNGSKILGCTEGSIIRAVLDCALIDLYPGGVQPGAWLIPRGRDLTVMVSRHGLVDLATRAGCRNIRARPVFEGEEFRMWLDEDGEHITHEMRHDIDRSWSSLVAVYCIGERPDGTRGVEMLGRSQIEARRAASQSKSGPWKNWPTEMAQGAVVKYAIRRGTFPISDRFALALDTIERADVIDAPRAAAKPAPATLTEWAAEAPATREVPALPDHGEPIDELEGITEQRERVEDVVPTARMPRPTPGSKAAARTRKPRSTGGMP